jgi:hypothetical protein
MSPKSGAVVRARPSYENSKGHWVQYHADQFGAGIATLNSGIPFVEDPTEHDVQADAAAVGDAELDAVRIMVAGVLGEIERLASRSRRRQEYRRHGWQSKDSDERAGGDSDTDQAFYSHGNPSF